ncbi:MAG: hypothetical protein MK101_05210 [Phycisphaerales bacterium]|nr:hypothetical protein [Phycisphaerales bacterium]
MLITSLVLTVSGAIINVPGDAPDPQAGVDLAAPGDTVLLSVGIHHGPVDLRGKAITLRGDSAEHTLLLGTESSSVICLISGETNKTTISDLTIAGGGGTWSEGGIRRGGGLCLDHASPTISRCIIVGNQADVGPAIWMSHGQPLLADCWFHGNEGGGSGAITCHESSPRLLRCGFHGEGIGWWDGPVVSIRADCDAPGGACCLGEFCVQTTSLACLDAGGYWHEDAACGSGVCPQPCPSDVNHDRRVNLTDLLRVLEAWGLCSP